MKPSDATVAAVSSWLASYDISYEAITPAKDWISFSIPVSKASELLNANYSIYTHTPSGKSYTRTLEYSIPAALSGHINAIHPTTSYVTFSVCYYIFFLSQHR